MSEIESVTDYWEEFFKDHPEPTDLWNLIEQDPILKKIYQFAAVPSISEKFGAYPFSQKIVEFESISEE